LTPGRRENALQTFTVTREQTDECRHARRPECDALRVKSFQDTLDDGIVTRTSLEVAENPDGRKSGAHGILISLVDFVRQSIEPGREPRDILASCRGFIHGSAEDPGIDLCRAQADSAIGIRLHKAHERFQAIRSWRPVIEAIDHREPDSSVGGIDTLVDPFPDPRIVPFFLAYLLGLFTSLPAESTADAPNRMLGLISGLAVRGGNVALEHLDRCLVASLAQKRRGASTHVNVLVLPQSQQDVLRQSVRNTGQGALRFPADLDIGVVECEPEAGDGSRRQLRREGADQTTHPDAVFVV